MDLFIKNKIVNFLNYIIYLNYNLNYNLKLIIFIT